MTIPDDQKIFVDIVRKETKVINMETKEMGLEERFIFRSISTKEADEAAEIEGICFPPNEACTKEAIVKRIGTAGELFLVAEERKSGKLAGFLNGIATNETDFRDDFFTNPKLHDSRGENIMLLGLDVLPEYRGQGLARELVRQYARQEAEKGRKRLILTCHKEKVEMYVKFGFCDQGESSSKWGGEKWHEMVLCLHSSESSFGRT